MELFETCNERHFQDKTFIYKEEIKTGKLLQIKKS